MPVPTSGTPCPAACHEYPSVDRFSSSVIWPSAPMSLPTFESSRLDTVAVGAVAAGGSVQTRPDGPNVSFSLKV